MTGAPLTLHLRARVNWPRLEHMKAHALARLRRAPKGERPALLSRFAAAMVRDCVRVEAKP